MGVKMCWIQIKMDHPLAQNGVTPFRANRAHPSSYGKTNHKLCVRIFMAFNGACTQLIQFRIKPPVLSGGRRRVHHAYMLLIFSTGQCHSLMKRWGRFSNQVGLQPCDLLDLAGKWSYSGFTDTIDFHLLLPD